VNTNPQWVVTPGGRKYSPVYIRSFSTCFRLLAFLLITSTLPSLLPSVTCFRRQFLRRMLAFLCLLLHVGYLCPPWLFVIHLNFSQYRSNWSPSVSSTTFQNFTRISDLFSEVSNFHHQIKLCSKCGTMTPLGIESATFQLVTQCLNEVSHSVPSLFYNT
jgi:hypothetical protein